MSAEGGAPARRGSEVSLRAVERKSAVLVLLMTAASLPFGSWKVTAGLAAGGAISLLNYWWLKRFVATVFLDRQGHVSRLGAALYVFKYLITGGVIFLLIARRLVDIFALMGGLLAVIMAITLEGVITTARQRKEGNKDAQ